MTESTTQENHAASSSLKHPLWDDQNSFVVKVLRPSDFIHLVKNTTIRCMPNYIRSRYSTKDFVYWIPVFYLTGMRYPEIWYLQKNEKWFHEDDGTIFIPRGYTKTARPRTVYLSDAGKNAVKHLWETSPLPGDSDERGNLTPKERQKGNTLLGQAFDALGEWVRFPKEEFGRKKIKHPVRDPDGNIVKDEKGHRKYNIEEKTVITHGLTYRSFRTSWETLLVHTWPERDQWIALSQGHDDVTQLRHYLNQGLDREDIEQGKPLTNGYVR